MTTVADPTALAFLAASWSATVTVANDLDHTAECGYCSEPDRPVTVRITHDPRPDDTRFAMRECCLPCAKDCVADAHTDHDPRSRRPIRVEVGHPQHPAAAAHCLRRARHRGARFS